MGRPLKIKKTTTTDVGFNPWSSLTAPDTPEGFTPGSATEYGGVVGGVGNGGGVATADYPVVKCRVFITGFSEDDGFIIRQKGSFKYLVEDVNGNQGVCVLANEADTALTEGNMNITLTLDDSSPVNIKKLTNKFALDYNNVRYAVNFFTDEGKEIKSGTDNVELSLGIVEKYTS